MEYLASQLYELTKPRDKVEAKSQGLTGVIASAVNARNYVALAAEVGILDRRTQTRGVYGSIYARLASAERVNALVEGRAEMGVKDFITLSHAERIFFLDLMLEQDYPFLGEIILWALRQRRFNRTTAMNTIMEEIYPNALERSLQQADPKKRELVRKEIEEARQFRDKRLSHRSQAEWIRTRQYAKYRHIAPPRLEWLVDLGILSREGRGKFSAKPEIVQLGYELERVLRLPPKRMREELFSSVYPYLGNWKKTGQGEITRTLIDAYYRLANTGMKQVKLEVLKLYTCFTLLEEGKITTPNTVHQVFNSLTIKYPDKVFVTPTTGEVEIAEDIGLVA